MNNTRKTKKYVCFGDVLSIREISNKYKIDYIELRKLLYKTTEKEVSNIVISFLKKS